MEVFLLWIWKIRIKKSSRARGGWTKGGSRSVSGGGRWKCKCALSFGAVVVVRNSRRDAALNSVD